MATALLDSSFRQVVERAVPVSVCSDGLERAIIAQTNSVTDSH